MKKPVRNKSGQFRSWPGGAKRKGNTHHGSMVGIGREFKAQKGRKPKVGSIVRRKNLDGSYNKGSPWFVFTPNGWRRVKYAKKRR